ncbi:MAG TPA: alpha/beta hydrolase [Stellaceae bacterium]|nr:alpha/beta hydrolase [Stellaceae bacterium]
MPIRTEDLEYYRPADVPLLARFYLPEGQAPFPAVLEVHGGAWTSGDRFNNVAIAEHLAAHGIAVLSIDFRMPPAARYPDTVADVNFGIRFLKANAERFATRQELVGGLGTSSGGHLLLLNALRPRDTRYASEPLPGSDASLAFAVACWPVADPLARYRAVIERGNDRLVEAHHQFWPSEEAMSEGSPQLILERGEPVDTPPALIMQGTADDNLTPDMAADFAAAYTKAGGSIAFHKFDGQPHAFIPRDPASPDARRALGLITDFIHHQTR